jgi:hypothetical protein
VSTIRYLKGRDACDQPGRASALLAVAGDVQDAVMESLMVNASVIACRGRSQNATGGALAAVGPFPGPAPGFEVAELLAPLTLHVGDGERVLNRRDEPPSGLEHAPQLGERSGPVLQVVQHQGCDDVVKRVVGERQCGAQIG